MSFWKRLFGKNQVDSSHPGHDQAADRGVSAKAPLPNAKPAANAVSSTLDNKDRVIRVFISSTFRDMKEDRDYLVKFIFPQLRKLCESRGVTWGEVDLRWGVPDEKVAEGKALPICLEEIRRCRPYFIGLLGERYGWVPDSIPDELLER